MAVERDRQTPAGRRRQKARSGYTVIEVMMALAVLSVGATGIIAMQKTALLGGVRARNLATANAIAATWVERLRLDAVQWTDAGGVQNIGSTRWLNVVGQDFPAVQDPEGEWLRPAPDGGFYVSPQADVRGMDTYTDAEAGFCTNLRLTQLTPTMIRAEIRVFWLRYQGRGTLGGSALCSGDPNYIANIGTKRDRYHFIYVTTGILKNVVD